MKEIIVVSEDFCEGCEVVKAFLNKIEVTYKDISPKEFKDKFGKNVDAIPMTCIAEDNNLLGCVVGVSRELNELLKVNYPPARGFQS